MNLLNTLRTSQLGCGLDTDHLKELADAFREITVLSGEALFHPGDTAESLFLIGQGRVRFAASGADGQNPFVEYLAAGEHFGEQALLRHDQRNATATAAMDSTLLELNIDRLEQLMEKIPRLAANLSRAMSYRMQRKTSGQKARPRVIGVVNTSWRTHALLPVVASTLVKKQEPIRVVTDSQVMDAPQGYRIEVGPEGLSSAAYVEWVRNQIGQQSNSQGHTFVSINRTASPETLARTLSQCDQVWWLAEPNHTKETNGRLNELLANEPKLAERIRWVWVLDQKTSPTSIPSAPQQLSSPDFKVVIDAPGQIASRMQKMTVSRLVNDLRHTRIGIALGGGAARGLAHLGVLKVLEREDIYPDMIVGTSAGALMALPYAFGWDVDFISETFTHDLTPSWPFKALPKGKEWFMLYKYRTHGWESMLRNHFADVRLDQLLTPLSTVTADLISGREVVRDTGDAVHGVLESINLPGISRPILRDGMALVDGGVLNNVPTDLLTARGADMVVGVDISSRLAHRFAGNVPGTSQDMMRRPSQLETVIRTNEVQDHAITRLRTSRIDFRFDIDASAFSFADFTKASELLELGEQQAEAMLPGLKQRIAEQEQAISDAGSLRFVCPCGSDRNSEPTKKSGRTLISASVAS